MYQCQCSAMLILDSVSMFRKLDSYPSILRVLPHFGKATYFSKWFSPSPSVIPTQFLENTVENNYLYY